MNTSFFACPNCRLYVESGYRWSYWLLEDPGLVQINEGVNVGSILACSEYWNPTEEDRSSWLCERVLPAVHRFLSDHREHGIIYVDEGSICNEESLYYGWTEIEI